MITQGKLFRSRMRNIDLGSWVNPLRYTLLAVDDEGYICYRISGNRLAVTTLFPLFPKHVKCIHIDGLDYNITYHSHVSNVLGQTVKENLVRLEVI